MNQEESLNFENPEIMIEACNYASGKLAEVASKDRFLRAIHRPT